MTVLSSKLSANKMDHSMMDHRNMDMPGHNMPDHNMPDHNMPSGSCQMNMVFSWDYQDTCVVFKQWHVKTRLQFIFTLIAIAAIGVGYEYFRARIKKFLNENSSIYSLSGQSTNSEYDSYSPSSYKRFKIISSALYAAQVFYSFFIMLIFMTFNGWYMIAVAVGAGVGNYFFDNFQANSLRLDYEQGLACH